MLQRGGCGDVCTRDGGLVLVAVEGDERKGVSVAPHAVGEVPSGNATGVCAASR